MGKDFQTNDFLTITPRAILASLEAENNCLGLMLRDRETIPSIVALVSAEDFYYEPNKRIFKAISELYDKGATIDHMTTWDVLSKKGNSDTIGGSVHLGNLRDFAENPDKAEEYAKTIQEWSALRQVETICDEAKGKIKSGDVTSVISILDSVTRNLDNVGSRFTTGGIYPVSELYDEIYDNLWRAKGGQPDESVKTGIAHLDNMIRGFQKGDYIILGARTSVGKCLAFDTPIVNPLTGARITIQEAVENKLLSIPNLGINYNVQEANITHWIDSGIKSTKKLRTQSGREITTTLHHPYLTVNGWKPVYDLQVGDYIAVPRSQPFFGNIDFDVNKVRVLSYLIAKGAISSDKIGFSNTDPVLIADFSNALSSFKYHKLSDKIDKGCNYRIITDRNGSELKQWIKELGLNTKSNHKFIPDFVFTLKKELIAQLIQVLFSCDAHLCPKRNVIDLCIASKQLAKDIHHLLCRFGIVARYSERTTGYKKKDGTRFTGKGYRVVISEPESIELYNQQIGWVGDKTTRVLPKRASKPSVNNPPKETWMLVKEACKEKGISLSQLGYLAGETTKQGKYSGHNAQTSRAISRTRLEKYAEILDNDMLKRIASKDVLWDKIVSIEYAGEVQVYDLTVPNGSNFIASDIFAHNTAFAIQMAMESGVTQGLPTVVFSLEMSRQQLMYRMISGISGVSAHKMRLGQISDSEWARVKEAMLVLKKSPIIIDDTPQLTPQEIKAKLKKLAHHTGEIGLVVIDYINIIKSNSKLDNSYAAVGEISGDLKAMAKELNVPLLVLAQLNRGTEGRQDKMPTIADIADSDKIARDADLVMLLYRNAYYDKKSNYVATQAQGITGQHQTALASGLNYSQGEEDNSAVLIVDKHRQGPTGTIELQFDKTTTKFTSGNRYKK